MACVLVVGTTWTTSTRVSVRACKKQSDVSFGSEHKKGAIDVVCQLRGVRVRRARAPHTRDMAVA